MCTKTGEIKVTGDFIKLSETNGVLIIVYSTTNESDVQYIFQNKSTVEVNVTDLRGGEYGVSVFVVGKNHLPFLRVADLPKVVMCGKKGINFRF